PLLGRTSTPRLEVSASREGALASAAQDDCPYRLISSQLVTCRAEIFAQGVVDGVQHLGPIEDEVGKVAVALDQHGGAHSATPTWFFRPRCSAIASSRMWQMPSLRRTGYGGGDTS